MDKKNIQYLILLAQANTQGLWKILKPQFFCIVWSVDILEFCLNFLAGRDFFLKRIKKWLKKIKKIK